MSQMRAADLIWYNTVNCVFVFEKGQQILIKRLDYESRSSRLFSPCPWWCWAADFSAEGTTDRQREGEHMRVRGCDRRWGSGCKHLPPAAGHGCNIALFYLWRKCFSLPSLCIGSAQRAARLARAGIIVNNLMAQQQPHFCFLCKNNSVKWWWWWWRWCMHVFV